MSTTTRQILDLAEQHKSRLFLIAMLAFGWTFYQMMSVAPYSDKDTANAIQRVYSLEAQPLVCLPARTPPTR